jgi:DNA-directed RNA polymerase subunit RPC12/RpoP
MRAYKLKKPCVLCGGEVTIYLYSEYEDLVCEQCGLIPYEDEEQYQ